VERVARRQGWPFRSLAIVEVFARAAPNSRSLTSTSDIPWSAASLIAVFVAMMPSNAPSAENTRTSG
jgi:hypothetical protein